MQSLHQPKSFSKCHKLVPKAGVMMGVISLSSTWRLRVKEAHAWIPLHKELKFSLFLVQLPLSCFSEVSSPLWATQLNKSVWTPFPNTCRTKDRDKWSDGFPTHRLITWLRRKTIPNENRTLMSLILPRSLRHGGSFALWTWQKKYRNTIMFGTANAWSSRPRIQSSIARQTLVSSLMHLKGSDGIFFLRFNSHVEFI